MAAVARAAPDGYTLALVPVGNAAVNPSLIADLPYDPVKHFAPITQIATVENVLVISANRRSVGSRSDRAGPIEGRPIDLRDARRRQHRASGGRVVGAGGRIH